MLVHFGEKYLVCGGSVSNNHFILLEAKACVHYVQQLLNIINPGDYLVLLMNEGGYRSVMPVH